MVWLDSCTGKAKVEPFGLHSEKGTGTRTERLTECPKGCDIPWMWLPRSFSSGSAMMGNDMVGAWYTGEAGQRGYHAKATPERDDDAARRGSSVQRSTFWLRDARPCT